MATRWTFEMLDAALRGKVRRCYLGVLRDIVTEPMTAEEIAQRAFQYRLWQCGRLRSSTWLVENLVELAALGSDGDFRAAVTAILDQMSRFQTPSRAASRPLAANLAALECIHALVNASSDKVDAVDALKDIANELFSAEDALEGIGWHFLRESLSSLYDLLEDVLRARARGEKIGDWDPEHLIARKIWRWLEAWGSITKAGHPEWVLEKPIRAALPHVERIVLSHLPA